MGSAWHKRSEKTRREWVAWAAGGIALLVTAGIVAGVLVAIRGSGGDEPSPSTAAVQPSDAAPSSPGPPTTQLPPTEASVEHAQSLPSPSPAPVPALKPSPSAQPSPRPSPAPTTPAPASPAPAAAAPLPAPTAGGKEPPSTYDRNAAPAPATPKYTAPPAPGFELVTIAAGKAGTCELRGKQKQHYCQDGMDAGATHTMPFALMALMHDPEMMETCGFTDMSAIVHGLVKWAWKGNCGLDAYTVARACIGEVGTAAEGHWRARVMLWPKAGSPDPDCKPLCVKMRGKGGAVTEYGRHGSCNENKT